MPATSSASVTLRRNHATWVTEPVWTVIVDASDFDIADNLPPLRPGGSRYDETGDQRPRTTTTGPTLTRLSVAAAARAPSGTSSTNSAGQS